MSKPVVYNYKTAEDKIAALKDLVNYMADRVVKLEADNRKLFRKIVNLSIMNRLLEINVDAWIPISEREPDTADHVLVTIKWSEDDFEVCSLDYGVLSASRSTWDKDIIKHVIAWRPLPEAYKGD